MFCPNRSVVLMNSQVHIRMEENYEACLARTELVVQRSVCHYRSYYVRYGRTASGSVLVGNRTQKLLCALEFQLRMFMRKVEMMGR